jgi:hypothetical protein
MNNKSIKSEQIIRESLDLDMVRIDEIIDKPDKVQDVILDEKHKIAILAQAIITEEATEFKRKKEIQKAKKESCCYRWCNCCYNQKQDTTNDEFCDNIFWYWYWYWYFNNDNNNNNNSYSNQENNNSNFCNCDCCDNCDCKCDCDGDCDCDCDD